MTTVPCSKAAIAVPRCCRRSAFAGRQSRSDLAPVPGGTLDAAISRDRLCRKVRSRGGGADQGALSSDLRRFRR